MPADECFAATLRRAVRRHLPGATGITGLRELSGGASKETWSFSATVDGEPVPLILRRARGRTASQLFDLDISLETEAEVHARARAAGVPAPEVRLVLDERDGLGHGFVMELIEGETIARKILRDDAYARARGVMARQCGEILAGIASVDAGGVGGLARVTPRAQLARFRTIYLGFDEPHPVFELAFKWLELRMPEKRPLGLVHGDFRNGNLIVGSEGVRAVIDWELAHVGDPMEDLGWLCINVWRFGVRDKPVGGFGEREALFAGYESISGRPVDPERVHFWEVLGCLNWGIICKMMAERHLSGNVHSVELATIGRRAMEAEIDLLNLIG